MTSRTTASFRKAFSELPRDVKERAREAFQLFSQNPQHPSLRVRQVHASEPIYSAANLAPVPSPRSSSG